MPSAWRAAPSWVATLALIATLGVTHAACAASATIAAGIYPSYPPLDMRDPQTDKLTGFDVDLGNALAAKLSARLDWVETNYAELIAAVKTGRIQIFFNGMSDTAERREQIAFVDYLRSGSQFMTMATTPLASPEALCGKKIGISRLTNMPAALQAWSAQHCEKAGKPAAIYVPADNSIDGRIQMKQGRTEAVLQDSLTVPRTLDQEKGKYLTVGEPFAYYEMGVGVGKQDAALQKRIAQALQQLIDDGTYAKMMAKWGLPASSALRQVTINDAPIPK
ncbi:ABC transporter substrate-binding protein [Robbsia sp. Bb-Pol-6]|uniref:ABC transporter substrate-binding protein n=1 Tax=Robbsia betulipollinis TaxID=2981849 RepID=A0ABT3ZTZ9_9BURK|nr:ABC transporter substrate-binding protein [Robbsia betulipollinis]